MAVASCWERLSGQRFGAALGWGGGGNVATQGYLVMTRSCCTSESGLVGRRKGGGEGDTLLEVQYFELLLSISLSLSALFGFVNLGDNDQADNLFLGPVCWSFRILSSKDVRCPRINTQLFLANSLTILDLRKKGRS